MRDWSNWPKEYYEKTDREERLTILKERLESGDADEKDRIRMEFWKLRYAQRDKMPEGVDYFIRSWMNMYFISKKPGAWWLKKQQIKELEEIKRDFGFELAKENGKDGEEVLYEELCHGVKFYIGLCKTDSKYSTQLIGLMKMKPNRLVEKIGNELWKISSVVPETFGQEEEFAILAGACRDVFWKEFPKYKADEEIKLGR